MRFPHGGAGPGLACRLASRREPQRATTQKGTLSNGRVVSYALGDVANNLAFQMTSMFLMVYMTDIVGLSAAAAFFMAAREKGGL